MSALTSTRMEWIEIRGFRAFGSEVRRLDLSSKLIVVHAGNSHGKTSMAEAAEWLITGRSSRRDLFGGAKAEYNASLRNAHLPPEDPVWVAAGIRDRDGVLRTVRRSLLADFAAAADCASQLTIDGQVATSLASIGIEAEDALAAPVLLQHTLRYVLSTEPKQRATYFKALLALSDLDVLRARVKAQAVGLEDIPLGPGGATVQRLSETRLSRTATGLQSINGNREELKAAVEEALVAAGRSLLGATYGSVRELREALERAVQEHNNRLLPLNELSGTDVPDLPALPNMHDYLEEVRRADKVESALLPLLTAVVDTSELAEVDHSVDCPVCLTPDALSPERIAEIRERLRDTNSLSASAAAAEKELSLFQSRITEWESRVRESRPTAAAWGRIRVDEVMSAAANLGEDVVKQLEPAIARAVDLAKSSVVITDSVTAVVSDVNRLVELVRRRAPIPETARLDLAPTKQALADYRISLADDEPLRALNQTVEPILRSRLQSEGISELLAVTGLIDEFVDERYVAIRRQAAVVRLRRVDRALQKAAATVLDKRFAAMSEAIERWWSTIRPEELVSFAGVKRRASGAVFVNLVAALQTDLHGETVERDALGIFSDSQLNALGLSTFLARNELVKAPFVFLDDPIPGSDGEHRLTFVQNTLASLLDANVQVVITTYDPKLAEHAQTVNEHHQPITYDLTLTNVVEGTEPAQTSDQFSNYMLQGEDGVNAPTAVGRANSSGAYRRAAERLAKQIIATNRTASGIPTSVAEVGAEANTLGDLIPLTVPFMLSADETGKWRVIPRVLNPGNHDDGAPSSSELKTVRGNLRQFARAHHAEWGKQFVR